MKSSAPCLAVVVAGLALMIFAAVGLAMQSDSRGGEALAVIAAKTTKAPPPPERERGIAVTCVARADARVVAVRSLCAASGLWGG